VNTGRITGTTNFIENNPLPITAALLKARSQRFTINARLATAQTGGQRIHTKNRCHGRGRNFMIDAFVELADGELFFVITNGRT